MINKLKEIYVVILNHLIIIASIFVTTAVGRLISNDLGLERDLFFIIGTPTVNFLIGPLLLMFILFIIKQTGYPKYIFPRDGIIMIILYICLFIVPVTISWELYINGSESTWFNNNRYLIVLQGIVLLAFILTLAIEHYSKIVIKGFKLIIVAICILSVIGLYIEREKKQQESVSLDLQLLSLYHIQIADAGEASDVSTSISAIKRSCDLSGMYIRTHHSLKNDMGYNVGSALYDKYYNKFEVNASGQVVNEEIKLKWIRKWSRYISYEFSGFYSENKGPLQYTHLGIFTINTLKNRTTKFLNKILIDIETHEESPNINF